jgi:hypothetical protein
MQRKTTAKTKVDCLKENHKRLLDKELLDKASFESMTS